MKLYLLDNPSRPSVFAQFCHVGTWSEGELCDACGQTLQHLIEPLQIEWDPGTETIGDFSWCGYTAVVRNDVRSFLEENGFECIFGRVEVLPPTGWKRTQRARVPFPYTGPELWWLIPTRRVALDEAASGVRLEIDCPRCGQKDYSFRRTGIVIRAGNWNREKLFLIDQFGESGAMFVPDFALAELIDRGITNLKPIEAGVIVD